MATWVDITNAEVAAGAPITTALMTALRDNQIAFAERDATAPKILGSPYDYQEFTTSGTWTKPANAETGDRVWVQVVAGGASGQRGATVPGSGGGGLLKMFNDIDDLPASTGVTVGAGGAGATGTTTNNGGNSLFSTNPGATSIPGYFLQANGGTASDGGEILHTTLFNINSQTPLGLDDTYKGGASRSSSVFGGGGGGVTVGVSPQYAGLGGMSTWAGRGGMGTDTTGNITDTAIDGEFPGGGGGAVNTGVTGDTVGGAGANGVVRVWCIKDN